MAPPKAIDPMLEKANAKISRIATIFFIKPPPINLIFPLDATFDFIRF